MKGQSYHNSIFTLLNQSKCSVSKLDNWTDELNYFLDCFMLSGLGNFVVDCPI